MPPPSPAVIAFPAAAVSCAVVREGHLLMVRRRNLPNAGRLALPGGRVEAGEPLAVAAERELLEETGVQGISVGPFTAIDVIDRDEAGRLRFHYVLVVMEMRWSSGEPVAADDALDACWMDLAALRAAREEVCSTALAVACRLLGAGNQR
ncbi:NUDIX hydrolase [Halomonas sp. Y3]|uniref:NUDIX hydrolase n=1 Tax=Halomonas sp. Y3 TaxID=2956797 RepID=UPI00209F67E9|nr:NUDIX hydrolase [Halomonas sp. Y3]